MGLYRLAVSQILDGNFHIWQDSPGMIRYRTRERGLRVLGP